VTQAAVASGAGLTPAFGVLPYVRDGATTGTAVTMVNPRCRAIVTAWRPAPARRDRTAGIGFDWVQTLR
jgi:hypothetical protein